MGLREGLGLVCRAYEFQPWWRRLTGCWEPCPLCRMRLKGRRPHKVLHERFNPANPYLYRWRIWPWLTWLTLGTVNANLHRIVRPDDDPDPHDHPFWFWFGVILEGGYEEEVNFAFRPPAGVSEIMSRRPGIWFFHGRHLHRISRLYRGESWSLVFMGPKVREWGFVDRATGCWTQWKAYIRGDRC